MRTRRPRSGRSTTTSRRPAGSTGSTTSGRRWPITRQAWNASGFRSRKSWAPAAPSTRWSRRCSTSPSARPTAATYCVASHYRPRAPRRPGMNRRQCVGEVMAVVGLAKPDQRPGPGHAGAGGRGVRDLRLRPSPGGRGVTPGLYPDHPAGRRRRGRAAPRLAGRRHRPARFTGRRAGSAPESAAAARPAKVSGACPAASQELGETLFDCARPRGPGRRPRVAVRRPAS